MKDGNEDDDSDYASQMPELDVSEQSNSQDATTDTAKTQTESSQNKTERTEEPPVVLQDEPSSADDPAATNQS